LLRRLAKQSNSILPLLSQKRQTPDTRDDWGCMTDLSLVLLYWRQNGAIRAFLAWFSISILDMWYIAS
jgi:hypothetical protein